MKVSPEKATTSSVEKSLKETIEKGRMRGGEYRVPAELTKNKEVQFDDEGHVN